MSHYSVGTVESMQQVREIFRPDTDYTLNWLFLSTSGVHGWYTTLDDLQEKAEKEITVLVVQPRMVRVLCGHIPVGEADIPWLREVVGRTVLGVIRSQQGNL